VPRPQRRQLLAAGPCEVASAAVGSWTFSLRSGFLNRSGGFVCVSCRGWVEQQQPARPSAGTVSDAGGQRTQPAGCVAVGHTLCRARAAQQGSGRERKGKTTFRRRCTVDVSRRWFWPRPGPAQRASARECVARRDAAVRATDGPISRALGARPGSMSRADGTNLAEEHRADELVDLGRVVQELQLLEHHLVLVVLRHQLAERLAHLCVLCRTRQSAIAARPPGAAPARAQVPGAADRPTRTNTRGPADALTRSAIRAGTSMGMARWQHGASARGGTAGSVGGGKGQPQQGGAEQRSEVAPVAGRPRGAHRASASASGAARALVPFPRPPVIHPRHSLPPPRRPAHLSACFGTP